MIAGFTAPGRPMTVRFRTFLLALVALSAGRANGAFECVAGTDGQWACVPAAPGARPPAVNSLPAAGTAPGGPARPASAGQRADPPASQSASPPASQPARQSASQPASQPDSATPASPASAAPAASEQPPSPPPSPTAPAAESEAALLDWVPRAQLPALAAARLPPVCTGAYIQPPAAPVADVKSPLITGDAASADYAIGSNVTLQGNVMFRYQNSQMATEHATFEENGETVTLRGHVVYRQPGLLIQGEDAHIVLSPRSAQVDNASFLIHAGSTRGTARRVVQEQDGSLTVTRGYLSRCEPGDDTWAMSTSAVSIDADRHFATARNAVLRVKGVPVAYVPYLKFPVSDERASGFLFPSLGRSTSNGLDAVVPYYFNLAPNYDLTLSPRWLSDRGVLVEAEARQLSAGMHNTLGVGLLPRDRNYDGTRTREEFRRLNLSRQFHAKDRWLVAFTHGGEIGDFDTSINYNAVSDLDYFIDLGTDLSIVSKTQLERRAAISYSAGGLDARLSGLRIQPLQVQLVTPYQRVPDLSVAYHGALPGLPLNYSLSSEWVRFDRSTDNLAGVAQLTGNRFHIEPRLTVPLINSFGHITTSVAYRYTQYTLQANDPTLDQNPRRGVGSASVDTGLVFDRAGAWFGSEVTQTLEPRLYYLWVQRERQDGLPLFDSSRLAFDYAQLFRENRFSGQDRINDANQVSAALTSRVLDSATGTERVRASVGRILHFTDRRVTLNSPLVDEHGNSPWTGEVAAQLMPSLSVRGNWVWDARTRVEDSGRVEVRYQPAPQYDGDQRILYVGYSRRANDIRQADVAAFWPVTDRLRLIGRYYYDIENDRVLEAFGGIELDGCCYRLRLVGRRYLKNAVSPLRSTTEKGVFFQVVLKGLAGFGGNLDNVLENGIPGYRGDEGAIR